MSVRQISGRSLSRALRTVIPLIACIAFAGRASMGCSGDDAAKPGASPGIDGSSTIDPNRPGDNGEVPADGSSGPAARPTFCEALVFFASFDRGYDAERGAPTAVAGGNAKLSPTGKFGGSVALRQTPDAGATVYYLGADGGPFAWPDEGTLSYWYRGSVFTDPPAAAYFVRVLQNAPEAVQILPAGLTVAVMGARFGMYDLTQQGNAQVFTFATRDVRPFLAADAFNHFAVGWRQPSRDAGAEDAGSPRALLAVNGGLGDVLSDASAPSSGPDGGPLPYRAEREYTWRNAQRNTFRLGGTMTSPPEGEIDDVAIYNRLLTFEEIAQLYRAGTSVAALCRL